MTVYSPVLYFFSVYQDWGCFPWLDIPADAEKWKSCQNISQSSIALKSNALISWRCYMRPLNLTIVVGQYFPWCFIFCFIRKPRNAIQHENFFSPFVWFIGVITLQRIHCFSKPHFLITKRYSSIATLLYTAFKKSTTGRILNIQSCSGFP